MLKTQKIVVFLVSARMQTGSMTTRNMTTKNTAITATEVHRLTAFSTTTTGGNPAGVWVGTALPTDGEMLAIAAEIAYSETVFAVVDPAGPHAAGLTSAAEGMPTRYFSPLAEVPFCGHATIALGAHLGQVYGAGNYLLATRAGSIPLKVEHKAEQWTATLTSVEPTSVLVDEDEAAAGLLDSVLALLHGDNTALDNTVLDSDRPPAIAYAGARHLVLTLKDRATLANVSYDFEPMKALMAEHDLTTIDLVWHEQDGPGHRSVQDPQRLSPAGTTSVVHSRNLFAIGGVVEDPATGAAAAALVGHLRSSGQIEGPHNVTIHQGHDMGRPSLLQVFAPISGGIEVTGTAVPIPG